jgi:hypothetical protein
MAVKNQQAAPWLWDLPQVQEIAARLFPDDGSALAMAARQFDLREAMPSTYIPAMERGSMRASVEVRTPYLNRALVTALSQLDQRALVGFGQKSVLRRILARYLPDALMDAPKRGFVFPSARFLNACAPEPPVVPGLPQARVAHAWSLRQRRGWETLAVRLVLLGAWLQPRNTPMVMEDVPVAFADR